MLIIPKIRHYIKDFFSQKPVRLDLKGEHSATTINVYYQTTHAMSKSTTILIVQYVLAPSSPIDENAVYVHIKC